MAWGNWRYWLSAAMFLILAGGMVGGCLPTAEESGPTPSALVKRFGVEPLILELRLDRERLTVAERLTVELRAETDEEHAVKFIEVKEFAGFAVAAASESKPELTAPGRVAVSFRYLLEPLAAGSAQIPALTVEAWKKAEADAAMSTVATEPVQVLVESLLAKDDAGESISDIAPPLAKPLNPWLLVGFGLTGVLVLALIVYAIRRWGRRIVPPPPPMPPHLLAYQALDRLLAADLLARGEIKPFYEALSDILRHYIEQRFRLRASEQTTEEFLAGLRRSLSPSNISGDSVQYPLGGGSVTGDAPALVESRHHLLLRDFLSHCDLVKFARYMPARAEAEESVEHCRRFVRETEPVADEIKPGGKA